MINTIPFKALCLAGLLALTGISFAQQPVYRQRMQAQQQQRPQRPAKEQIESQRIAYITQQLQLTPAEAKVFWPVYNEFDAKRRELRKNFKDSNNLEPAEIDKLSEQEASQMLDNQITESQRLLDLRKEYHGKFKTVIPASKVLKLYAAERDFQKVLIDRLRHNKQQARPN